MLFCFTANEVLTCRHQQKAARKEWSQAQHGYLCHRCCIWVQSRCSVLCHSGHHTADKACCSNLHCNVCAWYCWSHGWLHGLHRSAISPAFIVLCCAVLCCAVLCCAVLCCAVLCCAVLCCAALRCAVLYCMVLYCIVNMICHESAPHTIVVIGVDLRLGTRTANFMHRLQLCAVIAIVDDLVSSKLREQGGACRCCLKKRI